jgi:DNA-binding transcriptional LysR family regulator
VVNNARRLLAVNDEILHLTSGHIPRQTIRFGIPVDCAGSRIPAALSRFRERWPDVSYNVSSAPAEEGRRRFDRISTCNDIGIDFGAFARSSGDIFDTLNKENWISLGNCDEHERAGVYR